MRAILLIIFLFIVGCAKPIKERAQERLLVLDQESESEFGLSPQIHLNNQLSQAITTSSSTLVRSAIQRGANPDSVSINGETALTYSIKNKLDSIIYILLKAKADPNKKNFLNESPIHLSIIYDDPSAARMLLSKDSTNINVLNTNGETPIINALKSENKRIALMLITKNADLNIRSNSQESTDQIAYRRFDSNFSNLIVKLKMFARPDTFKQTIKNIVKQNDRTTLRYIKKIYTNKNLYYPLEMYIDIFSHENKKTIELAINTMYSTSTYNSYLQHIILTEAIKTDDVDIFKIVFKNSTKPNINLVDNKKRTLLSYAVERSDYTMSLNLRRLGADTFKEVNEELVINSCDYLTRKGQSRRRYKAFRDMLGC